MKVNDDGMKLLFKEKAVEILMTIYYESIGGNDVYIQYIASKVNSPHSYVWLIIKKFEESGIVECALEGRTKIIRLTDKGQSVAELVRSIIEILEN